MALKQVITRAFDGDEPPSQLAVSIVSLVELCQIAMPDPERLRAAIASAEFIAGAQGRAEEAGGSLALDKQVITTPITNLRHSIFGRGRQGDPVVLLLSEADSPEGPVVFCSVLVSRATEGDMVKAVTHVAERGPVTGAKLINAMGTRLRRVFWDIGGEAGILGMMVTGPENVDHLELPRAITAFNKAAPRN